MRFWQRFFSLFSCLVLLFVVFSIPVAAVDLQKKVHIYLSSHTNGVSFGQTNVIEGEVGTVENTLVAGNQNALTMRTAATLTHEDGSIILREGKKYSVLVENMTFRVTIPFAADRAILNYGDGARSSLIIELVYANGEEVVYQSEIFNISDYIIYNSARECHTFKLDILPDYDITKVRITEKLYVSQSTDLPPDAGSVTAVAGFESPLKVTISEEDNTEGLLGGLLEWVISIGEKVSDTFDVINSGFANIGTWISELPSKIWSVMENGIKRLFVPDDAYMTEYSNKWDLLLSDRLGAVYQVCDISVNSWGDIIAADQTDTILFPSVTIPLPEGASFTFGGYDVQIVPDGFSALATAVKSAVGILCTYLFVNGLLKRYEEVMGVRE